MGLRRHTFYNLAGSLLPVGLTLLTVPVYLKLIGQDRYGVLAIAWLLLGYFGLFDLGLGRATAQRIAALRDDSADARATAFWTALAMNTLLGCVGGLVLWPVARIFFLHYFKVSDALRPEIVATVPWLAAAVPMATVTGVLSGALQGRERFFELNVISLVGTLLFQIIPLGVAWRHGPELTWLLPAALFTRFIGLILYAVSCRKHVTRGHPVQVDPKQAGSLLRFGGWVSVTALLSPFMNIVDRFVIGVIHGAQAVTAYTVPTQLARRSLTIPGALASAIYPRLSTPNEEERLALASEALRCVFSVMTPLTVVGILLVRPFLCVWISPEFADQAFRVGVIAVGTFWANGLVDIIFVTLEASGRPEVVAKTNIFQIVPYLLFLALALRWWGVLGAIIAFATRIFFDLFTFATASRLLGTLLRGFVLPFSLVLATVGVALAFAQQPVPLALLGAPLVVGSLAFGWIRAPAAIRGSVEALFAATGTGWPRWIALRRPR